MDKFATDDVNRVVFGPKGGGAPLGLFRKTSLHTWKEGGIEGDRDRFEFREIGRDRWVISLFDASRQAHLDLDLLKKRVRYHVGHDAPYDLYAIEDSGTRPTGWLVNRVDFGGGGERLGAYRQIDSALWVEDDRDGQEQFRFDELSRDDWSVHLRDTSRNVDIQLDLQRDKVLFGVGIRTPSVVHFGAHTDLYDIRAASVKMNGWLVNKVEFDSGPDKLTGTLRQTGAQTWVEDSANAGHGIFEFREVNRDEWSVYLHDDGRGIDLQIDLHTRWIYYAAPGTPRREQYRVAATDRMERLGIPNGRTVNVIEIGDVNGDHRELLYQRGQASWIDAGTSSGQQTEFEEIGRDRWSLYLVDADASKYLHVDLLEGTVRQSNDGGWAERAQVLRTKSGINGWVANVIAHGRDDRVAGVFRQTGWTSWVEDDGAGGAALFHFEETSRDEHAIILYDRSRNFGLRLDVHGRKIEQRTGDGAWSPLYAIQNAQVTYEYWRAPHKITSRSVLAEDYTVSPGAPPTPHPVYRTSVSFAPHTRHVDVRASEEVTVEINETAYRIDPDRPARVLPERHGKLSISIPATELHAPRLLLHTNLMREGERHVIVPDVEVHEKVVGLKAGALYEARHTLGLKAGLDRQAIDHVQQAMVNVARTVQHSYNHTPHGVHHDRGIVPAHMEHPHFVMDFSNGGAAYSALSREEVLRHIEGAVRIDGDVAQSFLSGIGDLFKEATHVIVHTATAVVHDVVDTVDHVATDVVHTIDRAGEDLIHGDILEAGKDLIRGGEHLGEDLVHGGVTLGKDVASGAAQLVVVTLKAADKVVQFVLHHTGFVGKALGWLLEKAGAVLEKAVGWLLDQISWGDVVHTHDVIVDSVNRRLDEFERYPQALKVKADAFFTQLSAVIESDIDQALHTLNVPSVKARPAPVGPHSSAVEKVEWLIGKFMHYSHGTEPLATSFAPVAAGGGPMGDLANLITTEIGADAGKLRSTFGEAFDHLIRVFEDPSHAPEHLVGALLDVVKGVAVLGLRILNKVIDALLDLVAAAISGFKVLVNKEIDIPFVSDFYSGLAHGRKMTLLSITALIVATPTTILSKALFDVRPFDEAGAALAFTDGSGNSVTLTALTGTQRSVGLTYGSFHILASVVATAANSKATVDHIVGEAGFGPAAADASSLSRFDLTVGAMNVLLGVGAQATGNPITPGEDYVMPLEQAKTSVFDAPNYWSHVVWQYQWGCLLLDVLTVAGTSLAQGSHVTEGRLGIGGDVLAGFNTVRGCVHAALMGVLDQSDRAKTAALDRLLRTEYYRERELADEPDKPSSGWEALSDTRKAAIIESRRAAAQLIEQSAMDHDDHIPYGDSVAQSIRQERDEKIHAWLRELRNYYSWSHDLGNLDSGIPKKGFGNVMDAFPEIGQAGTIGQLAKATDGVSLAITAVLDVLGHDGEGITYIVRTHQDALL